MADLLDDITSKQILGTVTRLAQEMMLLLMEARATNAEGCGALATALIISLHDSEIDREEAMRLFGATWDTLIAAKPAVRLDA